ncbi:MAG: signal peptidase II [Rickettsiales bacterium]|nr:signal peptidase II [Rickettsiales bacterium]
MRNHYLLRGLLVAGLVALLDQLSKKVILMLVAQQAIPQSVTSFFNLVLVWNRGVSFGLLQGSDARHALIAFTFIMLVILLVWLSRVSQQSMSLALGLIAGGAFGNVLDRLIYGAVVDFLDVHVMGYHWPSFNVADACISSGVALLLWNSWCEGRATSLSASD